MAALQPHAGASGVPGGHASQLSPSSVPAISTPGTAAGSQGPPEEGAILDDWQRFAGMAVQRDGSVAVAYGAEEVEEAHEQKLIMVLFIGAAALTPGSPLPQIAMEASKLGAQCHVIMADDALHSEVVRWGGVAAIMKAPLQCIRSPDQLAEISKDPTPQAKAEGCSAEPRPPRKSVPGEVKALMARFDAQLLHVMGQVTELQQAMSASFASTAAATTPSAKSAPAPASATASAPPPDQMPVDIDSLTQALAEALAPPPPPEPQAPAVWALTSLL